MTIVYIYTFASVVLVSIISLVGVFTLSLKEEILRKYVFIFISIAVGALLGDAFIHLIPEALETFSNTTVTSILVIAGMLAFFIVEKFLHWHHHGEDKHDHGIPAGVGGIAGTPGIHPVGKLVMFSDGFHNFLDGIIIAASFTVSLPIGIATTIAVILHEIPQEVGDFAVLLHSGYTKKHALWLNFLSALAAVLGAVLLLVLDSAFGGAANFAELSAAWLLPIAAGGFIYIAASDLIPELHKTKKAGHSLLQLFAVALGVLAMVALTLLE